MPGLDQGPDRRARGQSQGLGAGVGDHRYQGLAGADIHVDLVVHRPGLEARDHALQVVSGAGAQERLARGGWGRQQYVAGVDQGQGRLAGGEAQFPGGLEGHPRHQAAAVAQVQDHLGVHRALADRDDLATQHVPSRSLHGQAPQEGGVKVGLSAAEPELQGAEDPLHLGIEAFVGSEHRPAVGGQAGRPAPGAAGLALDQGAGEEVVQGLHSVPGGPVADPLPVGRRRDRALAANVGQEGDAGRRHDRLAPPAESQAGLEGRPTRTGLELRRHGGRLARPPGCAGRTGRAGSPGRAGVHVGLRSGVSISRPASGSGPQGADRPARPAPGRSFPPGRSPPSARRHRKRCGPRP